MRYVVVPQRLSSGEIVWLCRTADGVTTHSTKKKALAFGETVKKKQPRLELVP